MSRPPTGRRELILDAALRSFTSRGYDGTTIGDLATELGFSKAAIAYYFPTKDTFLDKFVTPFLDDLDHSVPSIPDPVFPDDAHRLLGAYLDVVTAHHAVAVWFDTDPRLQNHATYGPRITAINKRLLDTITTRSRRKNDQARALSVLGGVWRPARGLTPQELTEHHDEIVQAAIDSY